MPPIPLSANQRRALTTEMAHYLEKNPGIDPTNTYQVTSGFVKNSAVLRKMEKFGMSSGDALKAATSVYDGMIVAYLQFKREGKTWDAGVAGTSATPPAVKYAKPPIQKAPPPPASAPPPPAPPQPEKPDVARGTEPAKAPGAGVPIKNMTLVTDRGDISFDYSRRKSPAAGLTKQCSLPGLGIVWVSPQTYAELTGS